MLSIIVPVYNKIEYLPACVDSVTSQTDSDWELILVDDGSTDGSEGLCDSYANAQIRVLHQKNAGQVAARDAGISAAKGDYLCFLDADDMLTADYVKSLNEAISATGADMIFFDRQWIGEDGKLLENKEPSLFDSQVITREDVCEKLILGLINTMWQKITRRELFEHASIPEEAKSIRIGEDLLETIPLVEGAKTFAYVRKPLYNYRMNFGSVSYNLKNRSIFDVDYTRGAVFDCVEQMGMLTPENEKLLYQQYLSEIGRELRYFVQENPDYKKEAAELAELERIKKARPWLDRVELEGWKKHALQLFYGGKYSRMKSYCNLLYFADKYVYQMLMKVKNH